MHSVGAGLQPQRGIPGKASSRLKPLPQDACTLDARLAQVRSLARADFSDPDRYLRRRLQGVAEGG